MNANWGKFITFEGGDGSGKTTVLEEISQSLAGSGIPYMVTREPGGIEIAEKIRHIILDPQNTAMDSRTEALLYAAARRQHLAEKVLPALAQGIHVLCDRFVDSSLAYQGHARGLGIEHILSVNSFATEGRQPDLTFYLDIEPEKGLARIAANQGREVNRLDLEGIAFHHKVREGYHLIRELFPERIVTINADRNKEEVIQEIKEHLSVILKGFRG
ncbi:dTMP kinase [Paenibacillus tuaregi]|uniref:dTMP kinase n=1 Tax=Paenibacillus tuaregi TaxID=1816681 RepID=UPI0008388B4B|nr:dTMP kinase [Paenibacillus tuaregi]